jgi:hypothetical protein
VLQSGLELNMLLISGKSNAFSLPMPAAVQ